MAAPDKVALRVLESSDAERYRVLLLGALQEAPAAFVTSYAEIKDSALSTFEQLLAAGETVDRCTLGAFSPGSKLIGSIATQRSAQRQTAHKAGVYRLYVLPAWRRRGIGRGLLEAAIAWARKSGGLRFLDIVAMESSDAARSLYRAAGFAPYAWEPEAVRIDGTYYALESLRMVLNHDR